MEILSQGIFTQEMIKKDKLNLRGNKVDRYIDFVFEGKDGMWGADDDTDIEYMYQHLVYTNKTSKLSGQQIRDGWLKHIKHEEQNYLWVSNQRALDLMISGIVPRKQAILQKIQILI